MSRLSQVWLTRGLTHASSVSVRVTSREFASATVTQSFTPSKLSAPPYFPAVVHAASLRMPSLPLPEVSFATSPDPSLKPRARTGPVVAEAGAHGTARAIPTATRAAHQKGREETRDGMSSLTASERCFVCSTHGDRL